MNIICDTREQTPWVFPENVTVTRQCLNVGDYALVQDCFFSLERKEKNDLLGSISSNWLRFCRELQRMKDQKHVARVIIVECDFEHFCFTENDGKIESPQNNHFRLTPQFIASRIAELTMMNVSVLFAGNAGYASALAYHILKKREREINRSFENEN